MRSWKVKDHHVINQVLDTKEKIHMLKKAPQISMRQVHQRNKIIFQRNHLHKAKKISKVQSKKPFFGHRSKGMKVFFMGIVIHVMDMVTNLLNVYLMKGDIMEDSITPQGVGDVIK
jgi:hypothetical protein